MTESPTTKLSLDLAKLIEQKAIEALAPLMAEMDRLSYPAEFKLIMWETVARKANTYAARHA